MFCNLNKMRPIPFSTKHSHSSVWGEGFWLFLIKLIGFLWFQLSCYLCWLIWMWWTRTLPLTTNSSPSNSMKPCFFNNIVPDKKLTGMGQTGHQKVHRAAQSQSWCQFNVTIATSYATDREQVETIDQLPSRLHPNCLNIVLNLNHISDVKNVFLSQGQMGCQDTTLSLLAARPGRPWTSWRLGRTRTVSTSCSAATKFPTSSTSMTP